MRQSLRGHQLPESLEELQQLERDNQLRFYRCLSCKKPFTEDNVFTEAGWVETQISGMCETCFDSIFSNDDDEKMKINLIAQTRGDPHIGISSSTFLIEDVGEVDDYPEHREDVKRAFRVAFFTLTGEGVDVYFSDELPA